MIGAFLIAITQIENTGSTGKVLIPLEIKKQIPLSKLEIVHVFSRHFHNRIWRVLFTSLSADKFQKALYLSASIFKDFLLKKISKTYIRVLTTFTNLKIFVFVTCPFIKLAVIRVFSDTYLIAVRLWS